MRTCLCSERISCSADFSFLHPYSLHRKIITRKSGSLFSLLAREKKCHSKQRKNVLHGKSEQFSTLTRNPLITHPLNLYSFGLMFCSCLVMIGKWNGKIWIQIYKKRDLNLLPILCGHEMFLVQVKMMSTLISNEYWYSKTLSSLDAAVKLTFYLSNSF